MIRAGVAGVGLIAACAVIGRVPNLVEAPASFLVLYSLAFVCYVAAVWWLPAGRTPEIVTLVVAVGIAARLALLPAPPTLSTDAYRYVWDARVAAAGVSPYAHAPTDPALAPLRDAELFPRLNHPTWRTIYPPAAQRFFQMVYGLRADSVLAMKLAIGLVELAGLAVVVGLLRAGGRPPSHAIVYAWNPLVLVEVWGAAHLDGVLVPLVAGAMWAMLRRRHAVAGALVGLAASLKLYPAALLALLPAAAWPAALAGFAAALLAGYAPALTSGSAMLGSLPQYLTEDRFNPGLVRSLLDVPAVTLAAGAAWIGAVAVVRRAAPLAERAVLLVGGLVLLSPNIFPWYAVWLVPLLAWAPAPSWIAFTGTVAFAYAFFLQQPWSVPGWARAIEFAPPALAATWWLLTRVAAPRWRERPT
ncbi:MAG TPA: glycosyltransferase 87 family protein [Methylomirabilota bacterium]|jgi:hypothetical protein|nr:glycosyltransferase 87 family protein [Methylomirabilota bacterium]